MSRVSVFNEWDPLEEIIVGRAENAQVPRCDLGLYAVEYRDDYDTPDSVPSGRYPDWVIEEAKEDLEALADTLKKLGVTVLRPDIFDHSIGFSTPDWQSEGLYNYCPRDLFLAIGTTIIEAPMTFRCRQYETLAYKKILLEYMASGTKWLSAPRPRLADGTYRVPMFEGDIAIENYEPIFDAANILRLDKDILYQVSDTGNKLGAEWLQCVLGKEYKIHLCEGIYTRSHIDSTFTAVRPGLLVASAERVNPTNLPAVFKGWEVIYMKDVVDIGSYGVPLASTDIGLNFIMVNPSLAIVDKNQLPLIKELELRKVDVIPLQLRHARTLSGGFHCVTLDVRRGSLRGN